MQGQTLRSSSFLVSAPARLLRPSRPSTLPFAPLLFESSLQPGGLNPCLRAANTFGLGGVCVCVRKWQAQHRLGTQHYKRHDERHHHTEAKPQAHAGSRQAVRNVKFCAAEGGRLALARSTASRALHVQPFNPFLCQDSQGPNDNLLLAYDTTTSQPRFAPETGSARLCRSFTQIVPFLLASLDHLNL